MFDLAKTDVFRDGDIILTIRPGHDPERLEQYMEAFKALGMEVHAYSDRGDHRQYMLVPDREALMEIHRESCRNSAGSIFANVDITKLAGAVSGEPVV